MVVFLTDFPNDAFELYTHIIWLQEQKVPQMSKIPEPKFLQP